MVSNCYGALSSTIPKCGTIGNSKPFYEIGPLLGPIFIPFTEETKNKSATHSLPTHMPARLVSAGVLGSCMFLVLGSLNVVFGGGENLYLYLNFSLSVSLSLSTYIYMFI